MTCGRAPFCVRYDVWRRGSPSQDIFVPFRVTNAGELFGFKH